MRKLLLSSLTIAFLLVGCLTTPRIDISSDEKMKSSIQKVKDSLPIEKQKEFEESLQIIALSQINLKNILSMQPNITNFTNDVKVILNNKTAEEVIQEAKKIKVAKEEENRKIEAAKLEKIKQMALEEIKVLEEKKAAAEKSKEILKKVEVVSATFEQRNEKYSTYKQPIINFIVKNSTEKAISRIYCVGTVKSIEREIPWIKEEFNYIIAGGLEPSETANWSLAPNKFSKWGEVITPDNAILEIEVLQIDGADEKEIASIREFTKEDEEKLQDLKSKYN